MNKLMLQTETHTSCDGQRGSAMIIAILVMVILTLLGISFLMMAETENRIAENERLSAQALYTAEAGTRLVKRWFDRPPFLAAYAGSNVSVPPIAAIDRTLRVIDDDGDPATATFAQDGSGSKPRYKQGIDIDSNGVDDLFDKPYRGTLHDALLGTEDGPDLRISEATTAGKTYLQAVSDKVLSGYPDVPGMEARIVQIDVYAPPYIQIAGTWTRYGLGTIKVIARIYDTVGGGEEVIAERQVKAVVNEMPYPGPFGPLHSCNDLDFNGNFTAHWGVTTAVAFSDVTNNHDKQPASLPRVISPSARVDLLWGYDAGAGSDADFQAYKTAIDGMEIEDPWYRYLSGEQIADAPNANVQPYPFDWVAGNPLADGHFPYHQGGADGTHSNWFQNTPLATCPQFDYETWKMVATSGGSDVHYYVWESGTSFKENGFGAAQTFQSITDQQEGLFFFDTRDSVAPYDSDGDGLEDDNLTPEIRISGGTWGTRGFLYLNALEFQTKGVTGRAATYKMPGEPWLDIDQDGQYDVGEPWVNLAYPTANITDPIVADAADDWGSGTPGTPVRNPKGPSVAGEAVVWGILYTAGEFNATGNANYHGSVVSKTSVGENSPAAGTPHIYWDETIQDDWPPAGWELPRVVITQWETDL